jgi:aminoglycoside/choline kinase family phosphotransferase/GTP:adenosylcobinamide-phosphate guanylyltransferase
MISPQRPDGPPVRRGRPYSQIAHLAESVHAFAAVDRALIAQGFSAPRILAEDLEAGLLLLEDLGTMPVVDAAGPMLERYAEATRLLASLHGRSLPSELPVGPERSHVLPPYDMDALLIEVELLLDWYCPDVVGTEPSGSVRAEFVHAWREALADIVAGPQTWTLRDYHSPNLIWLANRSGLARIGLVDFQDAVMGPPAYDVASLLQDARVTVPPDQELKLLGIYAATRRAAEPGFDTAAFATAYAIMAAQRATKILGIFARLNRRDGKPQYLGHLPRIRTYLLRNLEHPALARVKAWYQAQIPQLFPSEAAPEPAPEPGPTEELGSGPGLGAMVLAAGLGQRMRPITDTCPKPLVHVGGRALIDHALGRLREGGITKVVVNVHHLADQIEAHVARVEGLVITVSDERDALLETGGGVKRALPLLGPEFLVMNSDSLWTEPGAGNVGRLVAAWDSDRMDALLLLADRDSLGYDGPGDFDVDPDGRLTRRQPGGVAPDVYAGVAILKAASFADTPDGAFSLNLLFDRAIAADRLYGLRLDGEWLHVGTPEAIRAAEERLAASA